MCIISWEDGENQVLVKKTQKHVFLWGKNFGSTRHLCEKNEPTLDRFGGGVHGKSCWLIAYSGILQFVAGLFLKNTTLCGKILHFVVKHSVL